MSLDFLDINDVYILDETGEEVNKVTGLYTKDENATATEQSQARANIMAGGSNRNLLDNPWWGSGEVVNQRAVSTFTTGAYNIDRWYFYKSATASAAALSADGVAFTYASGDMQLTQSIPASVYDYIAGKTVTLSILLSDGTIVSGTGTASDSSLVTLIPRSTNFMGMIQGSNRTVYIRAYQNATIRAVKLELGSVSTLANDAPPNYVEELAKCQRYFWRLNGAANYSAYGLAVAPTTTSANLFVTTPVQMRATPTVTFSGTFQLRVYDSAGDTRGITAISVDTIASNVIKLNITAASLTVGWVMQLRNAGATGYIDFSADL